jgi:hypothetical protein
MLIGSSPSATATATLGVVSGTATEGLDFDITTNGSFTAPSKTLTFPSGSAQSQPFTIRVYDDAIVEGTENMVLGFTVNAGGGNAVPGDGRPNLTLTIYDNEVAPYGPTTATVSIGTSQGSMQGPFSAASVKQKFQTLFRVSDLSGAGVPLGNITGLALNLVKASGASFVYSNLTIKMGLTSQNSLYNGTTEFPLSDASFTTVYSSNYTTVNGWNSIGFTTPFAWNGTSNIVVEVCYDDGTLTDLNDDCLGYYDGSGVVSTVFAGVNCGSSFGAFSYYNSGIKPIIQFTYPDPGTQVDTVLNASRVEYLGPNTDIYFYDQATKKLMARIQNLSGFNYDCTQVIIDRSGTGATPFWNNTPANYLMDKTFHVIPTNNNPSGSYNITLYYTQQEVSGWQAATGQNLNNILLVKTTNAISSVTPGNPSGGGTTVTGIPVLSTIGTSTGLTYNFTTGFSGFGAGAVGVILATELLDFEGHLVNGRVALDWTTSSEESLYGFDVEKSTDGISFSKLAFVPAMGRSTSKKTYYFQDPGIPAAINYYRLRQVNQDNGYQYSKIILVRSAEGAFRVLNNPFTSTLDLQFEKVPQGPVSIRLSDMTGRQLFRSERSVSGTSRMTLDLSGYSIARGVYLLEVDYDAERHVAQVVKE